MYTDCWIRQSNTTVLSLFVQNSSGIVMAYKQQRQCKVCLHPAQLALSLRESIINFPQSYTLKQKSCINQPLLFISAVTCMWHLPVPWGSASVRTPQWFPYCLRSWTAYQSCQDPPSNVYLRFHLQIPSDSCVSWTVCRYQQQSQTYLHASLLWTPLPLPLSDVTGQHHMALGVHCSPMEQNVLMLTHPLC